jgi:acyl-CoA synthetase (AMP-forming)/AMP-acid ligase II
MNIGTISAKWAYHEPGREAIIDSPSGRRVTFGQLDESVRRLANGLRDGIGLDLGDRVAILSKNAAEYQETFLACGRAGLIAQPLNWRLGAAELARIVADGEPRALIVSDDLVATGDEIAHLADIGRLLQYGPGGDGTFEDLKAGASAEEPLWSSSVGDDDPFFILYTGGTTGESKGALHSHKSCFMGMLNQTVAERVLSMNYLAHGCPVVLMNFEAKQALEVIEAERVSAFLGITTMLNWMMAVEGFERYDLSSLRNIQYGGGPMPSTVVRAALDSFPCTLIQGYGQTEGTTMCFLSQEDHAKAIAGNRPERLRSCGREGFVTTVRLRDANGSETPRDGKTAGEIWVRSEANMLEYWRKPEITAATLVDGWMRTGDLATWDDEGYVFIVDRAKDMIISGGENIYSVQVEEAVSKHEAVLECAVVGVPDEVWGESVAAFVVLKPSHHATEKEIIEAARANLASYQKPRQVHFVDSLPKAVTGKVLKRKLRDPFWAELDTQV